MGEINNHAADTKRIAKNTMMLYVQMFFSMIVSLYTSRVLLNALGVSDFGLYNVVGGLVAMFALISSTLSSSVSRFITYELGKGDEQNIRRIFSTSLLIHIALAIVVILAMESVGVWFLNAKMVIPAERLTAANWVFQGSMISFAFGVLGVPYNACIIAHEKMGAFAYISIIQVVFNLANVIFIAYAPWHFDRLICYALLTVGVSVLIQAIYMYYCKHKFDECRRVKLVWYKDCWKSIGGFATWNFIGSLASRLKWDGVNILLNLFFGTIVNAARGIAGSVNAAVTAFASNFMTAINPQITKSYASGDRSYMISLVEKGSKYSFYILLILIMPIMFETNFILTLWLKQFPAHTVSFTRLALILTMTDTLANTFLTAQNATGNIKYFQIVTGLFLMLNFPFAWICLKLGMEPESVFYVAIVISVGNLFLRLSFLRKSISMSMMSFTKNVLLRVILVSLVAMILPVVAYLNMNEGFVRFIVVVIICIFSSILSIFFVGCSSGERCYLMSKIHNRLLRFK
jgi:O-antigen/teichoic acid export membrane protein